MPQVERFMPTSGYTMGVELAYFVVFTSSAQESQSVSNSGPSARSDPGLPHHSQMVSDALLYRSVISCTTASSPAVTSPALGRAWKASTPNFCVTA